MFWEIDLGQIDPTQLDLSDTNADQIRIFRHFLLHSKAKKFNKNIPHQIIISGTRYKLTLTHDILHRKNENKRGQDCFDVISNKAQPAGKGGLASFHKIEGTLIPELNGKLSYKNKHRGVKREGHDNNAELQANIEYNLTKRTVQKLGAKKPVIIPDEQVETKTGTQQIILESKDVSYTTMRFLEGVDLNKILNNENGKDCHIIKVSGEFSSDIKDMLDLGLYTAIIHIQRKDNKLDGEKRIEIIKRKNDTNDLESVELGSISHEEYQTLMSYSQRKKIEWISNKFPEFSNHYHKKPLLTPLERFDLTLKLLRQLQENFHDKRIVHLDLKPANIKYNRQTGDVTIFDLGASQDLDNKTNSLCGTTDYASPEQYKLFQIVRDLKKQLNAPQANQNAIKKQIENAIDNAGLDKKSDIYSIGLVLAEIWQNEGDEFSNVKDIINEMGNKEKESRISLEDSISKIEQLRIDFQYENNINIDDIKTAATYGFNAWKSCREALTNPNKVNIGKIITIINTHLTDEKVKNTKECIQAFTDALGIDAFKGLDSKEAISKKISNIKSEYNKAYTLFNKNHKSLEFMMRFLNQDKKSRFYKLINSMFIEIEHVGVKYSGAAPTVDKMVTLTNKMEKANQNVQRRLLNLDSIYQQNAVQKFTLSGVVSKLMENNDGQADENHISALRSLIKFALIKYLESSYTQSLISKNNAASQTRLKDMSEILDIVNNNTIDNPDTMITRINSRLDKVKRGVFQSNHYLLRGFGSSVLVNNIKSAIDTYQNTAKHQIKLKI